MIINWVVKFGLVLHITSQRMYDFGLKPIYKFEAGIFF